MLINSIDQFIKHIPTATGTEFTAIEPFLQQAEKQIINLLIGEDLFQYIKTEPVNDNLVMLTSRLLCYTAYRDAIPFVDLIQTPNGFGVVSNNNVAPASKERVERLLASCEKMIDLSTDLLINSILQTPTALIEWSKHRYFKNLTNCLFITGVNYANYSVENGNRADFLKAKSKLLAAQKNDLSEAISIDYVAELINQQRTNTVTADNEFVIENCKTILAKYIEPKGEHEAEEMLQQLINFLKKNIDSYTTYKDSAEYALRNAEVYANKQTDPTYFFGS